jgi:hypothetical protein
LGVTQTFVIAPFFYDIVYVPPVDHVTNDDGGYLSPLRLSSGNFTQLIYAFGELVLYVSVSVFMRHIERSRILDALILVCFFYAFSAIVDQITFYTGTSFLIDWFRNAKYTLWLDADFDGFRRIGGFFTESSIFSIYSSGIAGILISFVMQGYRRQLTIPLLFFNFIIMLLSTSTTSYVVIIVGFILLTIFSIKNFRRNPSLLFILTTILILLVALSLMLVLIFPSLISSAQYIFDTLLFSKLESTSGLERSAKNLEALQALFDTFGLGVGFGGARTSSFAVTVLSNLGIIGTIIYSFFLYDVIFSKQHLETDETSLLLRQASRFGMIGIILGSCVSLTIFDLGPFFYLLAAISNSTKEIHPKKLKRFAPTRTVLRGTVRR